MLLALCTAVISERDFAPNEWLFSNKSKWHLTDVATTQFKLQVEKATPYAKTRPVQSRRTLYLKLNRLPAEVTFFFFQEVR